MTTLYNLDKELIKSDKINIYVVRKILSETDSEKIPIADYENIRNKLFSSKTKFSFPPKYRNLTAVIACFFVLLFGVFTIPNLIKNSNDEQDFEPLFIGLPVDNFNLDEIEDDSLMDRIGYSKLSDFFAHYHSVPISFVFVHVTDTEQSEEKISPYSVSTMLLQTSSLQILSTVWSQKSDMPENITLVQTLFGGCMLDEKTNMLRKDGVYLLPLFYNEKNDVYHIAGDLDVLFEIDENGRVWSHSPFAGFNRFDGLDARKLIEYINVYTSDENFHAAITRFGWNIRENWSMLLEVTHLSVIPSQDRLNYDCYEHTFRVENILSQGTDRIPKPVIGDEITIKSYYQITQIHLETNRRYLIFYGRDEDVQNAQIGPGDIAKINDDGTISEIFTPPDYVHRIFEEYNGYTVEQIKDEVTRAKMWQEKHVK